MKDIIYYGFLVRYGESEDRNCLINWERIGLDDVYFYDV